MALLKKRIFGDSSKFRQRIAKFWEPYASIPMLGWLLGMLVAVLLEFAIGTQFARVLGLSKIPALFGIIFILQKYWLFPIAVLYVIVIYLLPIGLVARATKSITNTIAAKLLEFRPWISAIIHLALLYLILHIWTDVSDYRLLVARLIMVFIIVTVSLNVVNGYMGEFSCSHPGFIALGAYAASVFTVGLFIDSNLLGPAFLPESLGRFMFPLALILGGVVALFLVVFIIRRMMRLMWVALLVAVLVAAWLLFRHGGLDRLTQASWWPW